MVAFITFLPLKAIRRNFLFCEFTFYKRQIDVLLFEIIDYMKIYHQILCKLEQDYYQDITRFIFLVLPIPNF